MEYPFTLTLSDGRKITGLGKNGDNYVSPTKIDESVFENNLDVMIASDGNWQVVYHNAELVQQQPWPDGTWYLTFREKTSQELAEEDLRKTVTDNANNIADLQLALTEIYEMIQGGAQ